MRNMPKAKLRMDFHDNKLSIIRSMLSEAYFPASKASASLVNLPMKKAGMIYLAFNLDIPAAKNKGVVGIGKRE